MIAGKGEHQRPPPNEVVDRVVSEVREQNLDDALRHMPGYACERATPLATCQRQQRPRPRDRERQVLGPLLEIEVARDDRRLQGSGPCASPR